MTPLDEMTLNERVKIYAEGDLENEIPPHSFDFTREDEKNTHRQMGVLKSITHHSSFSTLPFGRLLHGH